MRAETLARLGLLALAACSGEDLILGEGNLRPVGRGPAPMDAAVDAAPVAPVDASVEVQFAEPRVIEGLSSEDTKDDDPSLTEDRLLLCFNSKRDGGEGEEDILCATRASVTAPWSAPQPLADLNSDARETGIALALDGLTLWFSSDRDGGDGGLDVYVTARASREASWSEAVRVPQLSSPDDDLVSAVDQSGRLLLLARRENDDDDYDVWMAERTTATDVWRAPEPLEGVNTDEEESDAFLVGPGLSLLFTRDEDLMLAQRASSTAPFDQAEPLAAINSGDDDRDAWANATLTYVVFSSDRDGSHKLYEAERR